ncbi:MAG: SGNH/GDSL hydrolase family protein [Patescibacteria group bacterium]
MAIASDTPDVAILSFGTNDILFLYNVVVNWGGNPSTLDIGQIITNYRSLADIATQANLSAFFALTPPVKSTYIHNPLYNDLVNDMNNRLRHTSSAERFIDFHTFMVDPTDFLNDLHFTNSGQTKRTTAAVQEIKN